MTLREQVEALLPGWESWYPSLFDAACDLGLLRARVCPPGSLLLSSRHASVRAEAEHAHREKWGGVEDEPSCAARTARAAGRSAPSRHRRRNRGAHG